jgi:hypothetical protein
MCATKFASEFFQISNYMQHHSKDIFNLQTLAKLPMLLEVA